MVDFALDGETKKMSATFYRGETVNFYPQDSSFDRDDAVVTYLAKGLMPPEPMIGPDTVTVASGSCFAAHMSNHLSNLGFNVPTKGEARAYISTMGDGIVNTYAIRQQFEWAWQGRVPEVPLWHGYDGKEFGYDEEVREQTRRIFDSAEVFILTLGLSEIWYDEPTGEVFWRAVPTNRIDPSRHKFRNTSVGENVANLEAIYSLIRQHQPDATIVFSLSPVGLTATFRGIPGIVANSVSKATLRAALDEFTRHHAGDRNLFYFPSYEVVTTCFERPFIDDRKHPHWTAVDFNLTLFERYFCQTGMTDADLLTAWRAARAEDRRLPQMTSVEAQAAFQRQSDERSEEMRRLHAEAKAVAEQKRVELMQQREAERQARLDAHKERLEARRRSAGTAG